MDNYTEKYNQDGPNVEMDSVSQEDMDDDNMDDYPPGPASWAGFSVPCPPSDSLWSALGIRAFKPSAPPQLATFSHPPNMVVAPVTVS